MDIRQIRSYDKSTEEADPLKLSAFERYFQKDGGRLSDVSPDALWFKLRYRDYIKKFATIRAFRNYLTNVHFDFVDNPTLNAVAAQYDNCYLIGCYLGAMKNIQGLFTLMLSSPDVLKRIGNPAKEKRWLRSLESCSFVTPLETIISNAEIYELPPPDFPIDPKRKLYAHRLAILAMDFLFFHEMGHLVNGHLEYLQQAAVRLSKSCARPGPPRRLHSAAKLSKLTRTARRSWL
ncbi:MAG: hypothetical protein ACT4OT_17160 [Acidobacteriota bacterium]